MKIEANSLSSVVGSSAAQQGSNAAKEKYVEVKKIDTAGVSSAQEISRKSKDELNLNEKQWIEVIERANKALEGAYTTFEFSIHEKTKEIMVKVVDKETHKVLREFPPEKILDLVAKIWEMAGIIVDERR